MNGYFVGLYWTHYCNFMPHKTKLVDADVERECENFSPNVDGVVEEIAIGGTTYNGS